MDLDRTAAPDRGALAPTHAASAAAVSVDEFERLTMPFFADVVRFARSLARDPVGADDLVQETYLQALRGWHTFRPDADPRRWLFTVCHHTFLRTARRDSSYVEAPDGDPDLESLATTTAHWHAQESGVAELAERMDLGPAIDHALTTLPAYFRAAVVLVDVEGQTYEEAALILGVPVGTVRSRLFRGRRLLQDLLFEYARDAGFASLRPPSNLRRSASTEGAATSEGSQGSEQPDPNSDAQSSSRPMGLR
jgi:RNA polymerase sigma-70 factor, ECF subfamily